MKYKLAYLCGTSSWGGLEMNQLRNAIWMQQRGHAVVILCCGNSPIEENARKENVKVIQIDRHRKYYDIGKGLALVQIIKREQITHLIVRATYDMSIAAFAKWKLRNNLHLSYFMEMQLGISKRNIFHSLRFRKFDLWACPLHWLAQQVKVMTRFPKERIRVIPSGLDLHQFSSEKKMQDARQVLGLPIDGFLFGLIGRFDVHKGQLLLLDAMQKCNQTNFSVVFLGEPTRNEGETYFAQMQQRINNHQLSHRVFILPFRKEIVDFYKAINCFVMASKSETFGMVTIEAMACGTQILGSSSGGTPEILQQGKLGLLFKASDSDDLAQKLKQAIAGSHFVAPEILKEEAGKYSHSVVCQKVEEALGLNNVAI
ncbi:MAG: glycosyltransferase family 4 protein [Ferruginibacter sp.]|nr:glycosyltransferase family 4 protein [Ferruginibacter sp.]